MCCGKDKPATPSARTGQVVSQLRGNIFRVNVPGVGSVTATARASNIRPLMNVTVVQVGAAWRVV